MNVIDIIILAVMGLCVFIGYRRGLIQTVFRLLSFFISILLTSGLYPYVSQFLRGTPIYDMLKAAVINSLGLDHFLQVQTAPLQTGLEAVVGNLPLPTGLAGVAGNLPLPAGGLEAVASDLPTGLDAVVGNLPLPDMLKNSLVSNNLPDIYKLLNVSTIEEYIGGYIANIALNAISAVTVFVLVYLLMRLLGGTLNIIGKLPVIRTFNRAGGAAAGLLAGLLLVWGGLALVNVLLVGPSFAAVTEGLDGSLIAGWLYENNFFMGMLTKV